MSDNEGGSVLVTMSLPQLVAFWRPGSHDWTWKEEFLDLIYDRAEYTNKVLQRCLLEGWGYADDYAPILLGSDGRVWDGHHRICLAIQRGVPELRVEIA